MKVAQFIDRAAPSIPWCWFGRKRYGKELVARAIHYKSGTTPFVVVSCAALSESLIESELFGHIKGSFTGATGDRAGRFGWRMRNDFLDRSAADQQLPEKLLRVLERGKYLGSGKGVRKVMCGCWPQQTATQAQSQRQDDSEDLFIGCCSRACLRCAGGRDVQILVSIHVHVRGAAAARAEFSDEATRLMLSLAGKRAGTRKLCERIAVLCPNEIIGNRRFEVQAATAGIKSTVLMAKPVDSSEIPKPSDSILVPIPVDSSGCKAVGQRDGANSGGQDERRRHRKNSRI